MNSASLIRATIQNCQKNNPFGLEIRIKFAENFFRSKFLLRLPTNRCFVLCGSCCHVIPHQRFLFRCLVRFREAFSFNKSSGLERTLTFIFQVTMPWSSDGWCFLYLVEATYDAFTDRTTAFIKFLAAWDTKISQTIVSPHTSL